MTPAKPIRSLSIPSWGQQNSPASLIFLCLKGLYECILDFSPFYFWVIWVSLLSILIDFVGNIEWYSNNELTVESLRHSIHNKQICMIERLFTFTSNLCCTTFLLISKYRKFIGPRHLCSHQEPGTSRGTCSKGGILEHLDKTLNFSPFLTTIFDAPSVHLAQLSCGCPGSCRAHELPANTFVGTV